MQTQTISPTTSVDTALSAQSQLFIELSDLLEEWSDLMIKGDYEGFSEAAHPARLGEVIAAIATARKTGGTFREALSLGPPALKVEKDYRTATRRLNLSAQKAQALMQRGLMFSHTMLSAMGAANGYGGNGRSAVSVAQNLVCAA